MSKKSRDRASAAMALLVERFPRCFDERNRRPLKIGINAHVVVAMAGTMTARDVANALRFYAGSVLYQRALKAMPCRKDGEHRQSATNSYRLIHPSPQNRQSKCALLFIFYPILGRQRFD